MIIPKQCKAARALLDWKQSDLAAAARVSLTTIKNFEASLKKANYITVQAIQMALEKAGIEFLGDTGVKLK
jgi:transcriptional regulator with XRE-family HTH domain